MIRGYTCCSLPSPPDLAAAPSNGTLKRENKTPTVLAVKSPFCVWNWFSLLSLRGSHSLQVYLAETPKPSALLCLTATLFCLGTCLLCALFGWLICLSLSQLFSLLLGGVSLFCAFMAGYTCKGFFGGEALAFLKEYLRSTGWSCLQLVKL